MIKSARAVFAAGILLLTLPLPVVPLGFAAPVKGQQIKEQQPLFTLKTPDAHTIAWARDGRYLATAATMDYLGPGEVRLWNAHSGKLVHTLKYQAEIHDIEFSPDSRILAFVVDDNIQLWNVVAWKRLRTLRSPKGLIGSLAFSPDGKSLASGGDMNEDGYTDNAYLWDTHSGKRKFTFRQSDGLCDVVFTPDGRKIAGTFYSGYYNHDEDNVLKVWDARSGKLLLARQNPWTVCIAMSSDGQTIATGSDNHNKPHAAGEIRLWNAQNGRLLRAFKHETGITALAYSSNGKLRASGDTNSIVRIADAKTGQVRQEIHTHQYDAERGGISSLAFSPDGKRVASVCGSTVKIWAMK